MRSFDELVAEAASAEVGGWGFGWLDGRATEERPSWGYARLLAGRLSRANSALDIDTGGGEVVNEAAVLPSSMVVTESWAPNVARARALLSPRSVQVIETVDGQPLPFPDVSFDLVTSRHPVQPDWQEIARVLRPGGHYLAQHVGSEFYDAGAVVWTLRKCVWWVPGFTIAKYEDKLRELDAQMREGQAFVALPVRLY